MNPVPVAPPVTEYLYRKASAHGVPLSGTFELTPLCNMKCKMCYVRLSGQEQKSIAPLKNAEAWLALGREAREAGMLYLLVTGGEPFLHPQAREILEGLHALGLLVTINSNGTMIDENILTWLKKCPPVRINISLYGASDATYARLCGNPVGFTQVTRAIRLLTEAGIQVKLNCSLTPHNADDLPKIAKFAEENKLTLQVASYMFPPVRRDGTMTGKNDRLSAQDAAYYMAYADYLTLGEKKFLAGEGSVKLPTDPEEACAEMGDGVRCRAGRCSFWITWQGNMTPCGMFPAEGSPNVFEVSFREAWEEVKSYTAGIRLPGKCAGCNVKDTCRACSAMVLAESGRFDRVPQYRCQMMRAYPAQYKRVKEEILWEKQNTAAF